MVVNKTSPLLYRVLGIFLPLITTNCIVLGVALLNASKAGFTFLTATVNGFAAGLGFSWCWCCSPPCVSASPLPMCPDRSGARRSA